MSTPSTNPNYGSTASTPDPPTENAHHTLSVHFGMAAALRALRNSYISEILHYACLAMCFGGAPLAVYLFMQYPQFAQWFFDHSPGIGMFASLSSNAMFIYILSTAFSGAPMYSMHNTKAMVASVIICLTSGLVFGVLAVDYVAVYLKLGKLDDEGVLHRMTDEDVKNATDDVGGLSPDSWIFLVATFVTVLSILMMVLRVFHWLQFEAELPRVIQAVSPGLASFRAEINLGPSEENVPT